MSLQIIEHNNGKILERASRSVRNDSCAIHSPQLA